jgi:hypothetical protein
MTAPPQVAESLTQSLLESAPACAATVRAAAAAGGALTGWSREQVVVVTGRIWAQGGVEVYHGFYNHMPAAIKVGMSTTFGGRKRRRGGLLRA